MRDHNFTVLIKVLISVQESIEKSTHKHLAAIRQDVIVVQKGESSRDLVVKGDRLIASVSPQMQSSVRHAAC